MRSRACSRSSHARSTRPRRRASWTPTRTPSSPRDRTSDERPTPEETRRGALWRIVLLTLFISVGRCFFLRSRVRRTRACRLTPLMSCRSRSMRQSTPCAGCKREEIKTHAPGVPIAGSALPLRVAIAIGAAARARFFFLFFFFACLARSFSFVYTWPNCQLQASCRLQCSQRTRADEPPSSAAFCQPIACASHRAATKGSKRRIRIISCT